MSLSIRNRLVRPPMKDDSRMAPFLEAKSLSKTFLDSRGMPFAALEGISLAASEAEFLAIVGPSGCGKTTLLRLLSRLDKPTTGEVRLRGEVLTAPRREIGLVFQRANLMPWRTVLRNIALPLEVDHTEPEAAAARAISWASLMGLDGFFDAYPNQISGG